MRKTKIVCTLGPATDDPEILEGLIRAGLNVARLNFSHGSHAEHGRRIAMLREIAPRIGRPVAILQDLAGPKIRIGPIAAGTIQLESGQRFTLTSRDVPGDEDEVGLTYTDLPREVEPGHILLLSDGALELVVERVRGEDIQCTVVVGGPLSSNKGINLPTSTIRAPILSEKDREDLRFGLEQGVDYVALSFVRSAEDVRTARDCVAELGGEVPLIAKIEKHEALDHIDAIIDAVDGVMVARGDLGVEIPIEHVPRVQKMLIAKCNRAAKPVITATQMLKSMVESPRPTRAEATDVANAILDGTDAVMLSEETAVGRYPVRTVEIMSRIAEGAESTFPYVTWTASFDGGETPRTPQEAVAHAACHLAEDLRAAAILTTTQSGSTTRLVAKFRPAQPIVATTPDERVYRRLALVWGARPMMMAPCDDETEMEAQAMALAQGAGLVHPGEKAILTAGVPLHVTGTTNLIRVAEAK